MIWYETLVVGSNPTSATNYTNKINDSDYPQRLFFGFFCVLCLIIKVDKKNITQIKKR